MLSLRPATSTDARFVWECRNDPQAQAMSGSTGAIPYPVHVSWFAGRLADPGCRFQIGQTSDHTTVGYVRVDGGTISVAVHPVLRGLGFASELIRLGSELSERLTAWIRPENQASKRAFAAAGYRIMDASPPLERWEWQRADR